MFMNIIVFMLKNSESSVEQTENESRFSNTRA